MEPFSASASVVGIASGAANGVGLLYATIGRIQDAPKSIRSIRVDLEALGLVLGQLNTALKSDASDIVLDNTLIPVLQNCNRACTEFNTAVNHWTRHSTQDQMSRGDRWNIGIFHQRKIDALTAELRACKQSLSTAYAAANYLNSSRIQIAHEAMGPMLTQLEDSLKKSMLGVLTQQTAMNGVVQKLLTGDGESQEAAGLIQQLRQQKAENEALNQKSEELLQKALEERSKQKIYNVKATDYSFNLVGLINAPPRPEAIIQQDISDITSDKYSFTATGIVNDVDFANLVTAMRKSK
ncbi:hypothetical protein AK830_g9861 [Neonectria ditissima]|uniref:Azaphilone pigments biosynthesis cluster protein L N-terminal domain-containing protein n=1 Tax=Neonectria ditissima TaxID=78410 RepID=A0A0P7ATY2_9HYPO|nr:hypothetical protein AK830_g9861 [Neonectria ditissima]